MLPPWEECARGTAVRGIQIPDRHRSALGFEPNNFTQAHVTIARRPITWVARLGAALYFRVRYSGNLIPPEGSVLLVANHPNSLLDPVLVLAAARRPVRFLAKAPLFDDPLTGWFVRLGGAIPVHRRQDAAMGAVQNDAMFASVHAALLAGDAIGLFPEGVSHSGASLAPLKTGAARIALGAARQIGGAFPIVPVGLVFRSKDTFRSRALVLRGEPVAWSDLAERRTDDVDAVRELTGRIEASLRRQTINLLSWQDQPAVEMAVRIWEAEQRVLPDGGGRVLRIGEAARMLEQARDVSDPEVQTIVEELATHARRLDRLRLRPADLASGPGSKRGSLRALSVLPMLLPLSLAVAVASWLAFLVPYQLTGFVTRRLHLAEDIRSTWKALLGSAIYLIWMMALTALVWRYSGWPLALIVLVGLPVIGVVGLIIRERWGGAWQDARRFLLVRSRRSLVASLGLRQRELAAHLEHFLLRYPAVEEP
ncbi:MAG: 1-acyl-sn-glycerol-3-phosphate acyltransferase [Gemmatimonadota bacterium]